MDFNKFNLLEVIIMLKKRAKGLNIIIVGCGSVGSTLVERLCLESHDVTVIDRDSETLSEITNRYDIMGVLGNGASFDVLEDAGIKDADLIIAVTGSDELNLLCCTVASQSSECAAIARVRNPDYNHDKQYLRDKLGLTMIITPEQDSSTEIIRILAVPNALEVSSFAHDEVELVKFKIKPNSLLDGMKIADLGAKTKNVLICAVERKSEIIIPSGSFELKAGDNISITVPKKDIKTFFKQINIKTNSVKTAMIIGGGDFCYYLSNELTKAGVQVKIIEKNKSRCDELFNLIPEAVIINGDATDNELLREEGIESTDAFITLTGSDEENILLSLYAKQLLHPSAKLMTKINRLKFNDVIDELDLGSIINPRYTTTESIIAYVRAVSASRSNNIITLSHIFNQRVEAIEFNVDDDCELIGKPISKMHLKKETLITSINRGHEIIIPSGQDSIMAGDTVTILTKSTGFVDISDILV